MIVYKMKAYIFDLDGTLFDSMNIWSQVDVEFLEKRGIAVPADYGNKISAMTFPEAAAYTKKRFNLPDTEESVMLEWNSMAAYSYGHTVRMKPHAKEYLSALRERGAKLAVATSLMPQLCESALRNHGIDFWFHAICRADEVGHGKSRPDVFLLAAQKLGVESRDCIVFEDILFAVKSAKSIGMTVCGVYDKASANDWQEIKKVADYAIRHFQDAPFFP